MINKIKEKGITLIALVVTIVILLILAGVTLSLSLSQNGLFGRAQNAADQYKKAQEDEEDLIRQLANDMETSSGDYSKYVGAKVTGYDLTTESCEITASTSGHTEAQNFTTDPNMQWRIWDYDGRTLRIIGDPTQKSLTLNGAAGYNNGVWAIEEICSKCYSNGKPGVEVTSLKRSDIQKVSSYDYTQYRHEQSGINAWKEVTNNSLKDEKLIYFGESKTYDINNKYPKMWEDNDRYWNSGEDKECKKWEEKGTENGQISEKMTEGLSSTVFKQSYYSHTYKEEEFPNKKYYNLIFRKADGQTGTGVYWLAGRWSFLFDDHCDFGVQMEGADVYSALCSSIGSSFSLQRTVRPIVSISLNESGCSIENISIDEDGYVTSCKLSWSTE